MFSDYTKCDALGLAALVRQKEVTPLELVEAAIAQIEAHNPQLNAVIHKMYDHAREAAQRPLNGGVFAGVPFLLKDLMAQYTGFPIRSGSRFLKDYIADHDSELAARYRAAGVMVLGKTNTPEFGLTPVTEPRLFGTTHNPYDLRRTSGGSSGGSAAAVAARMVPMAHGGDGGGSIRIPAACCGLFGMKPMRGRTPTGPDLNAPWQGSVVEHVITRSVRDSAAMLDATQGPDAGAPNYPPHPERPYLLEVTTAPGKLRIAYTSEPFLGKKVHPDCLKALDDSVKLLRELGHDVVEAAPKVDGPAIARAFLLVIASELHADIQTFARLFRRTATREDFELTTWALHVVGATISAREFIHAVHLLRANARSIGQFFRAHDVLLTPTLSSPPVISGTTEPSAPERLVLEVCGRLRAGWALKALNMLNLSAAKTFEFIPYTPLFNITGQPAMSVPLYWNGDGLPIGMQFVGRFGDEATLFRLAGQLEQARPWADRKPPLLAG